jgi:hypothetical protein
VSDAAEVFAGDLVLQQTVTIDLAGECQQSCEIPPLLISWNSPLLKSAEAKGAMEELGEVMVRDLALYEV